MAPFDFKGLPIVRRAYAKQILALAGVSDNPALEDAFAHVEREQFLGPPPWKISYGTQETPALILSDPVVVYQDAVFSLDPARGVNNGSPSLHARWLDALAPKPGDKIAHIGAGSGYYTAIIAQLVGETGHVTAVEFNEELAVRAREALASFSNVTVSHGNGMHLPDTPCDGIYVSFGVERPAVPWIEQLNLNGRLVFPLGVIRPPVMGFAFTSIAGGGFMITRKPDGFAAEYIGTAYFIGAEGEFAANEHDRDALKTAFKAGGAERVRHLIWNDNPPPESWFTGTGWALA